MGARRLISAIIVAICLVVPVVEAFDSWDHTLQDGNDTEANVVIVAVCVGFAFTLAASFAARVCELEVTEVPQHGRAPVIARTVAAIPRPAPASSPPVTLRI